MCGCGGDAVMMVLDIGVFCVIELAASERRLFVVHDDKGLTNPCFGPERVDERAFVAKSVLLYCVLPKLYCVGE